MQILDGKALAERILKDVKSRLERLAPARPPAIALLRVGDNPASLIYVRRKCKIAASIGMKTVCQELPADACEEEILQIIERWNRDPLIDGILVQVPLPNSHFHGAVFQAISPEKDVDGFNPTNMGNLAQELTTGFIPCTPKGILRLLDTYEIPLAGKNIVILGRSLIVGRPLSLLLGSRRVNGTVTLCHSQTRNLAQHTRQADIVISAIGRENFLRGSMVRTGSVVIDVGINRLEDPSSSHGYRLCGDGNFSELAEKCSFLTPVPGGVGPMTIAMLMENLLEAFLRRTTI